MQIFIVVRRAAECAISTLCLAACATTPTESAGIRLRVIESNQSTSADAPALNLRGEIVNSGTEPFTNGGCTRPAIAIDSLGRAGWVSVPSLQAEELVVCIRAYTVDPGSTAGFVATLARPDRSRYPVGIRLRARILVNGPAAGPSAEFTLSR